MSRYRRHVWSISGWEEWRASLRMAESADSPRSTPHRRQAIMQPAPCRPVRLQAPPQQPSHLLTEFGVELQLEFRDCLLMMSRNTSISHQRASYWHSPTSITPPSPKSFPWAQTGSGLNHFRIYTDPACFLSFKNSISEERPSNIHVSTRN